MVRWRCPDFAEVVAPRFGVTLSERSIGRLLNDRGYVRLNPRPQRPKADPEAQAAFKNFGDAVAAALPERAWGKPLKICFQDEARVGHQGTLTRIWAKRGSRPCAARDTRYEWGYLFGAACPARGVGDAGAAARQHPGR